MQPEEWQSAFELYKLVTERLESETEREEASVELERERAAEVHDLAAKLAGDQSLSYAETAERAGERTPGLGTVDERLSGHRTAPVLPEFEGPPDDQLEILFIGLRRAAVALEHEAARMRTTAEMLRLRAVVLLREQRENA